MSVCLSVDAYSGTTSYEAAYELYKRVQIYKGLKIYQAILLKRLRLGDMAKMDVGTGLDSRPCLVSIVFADVTSLHPK